MSRISDPLGIPSKWSSLDFTLSRFLNFTDYVYNQNAKQWNSSLTHPNDFN